MASLDVQGWCIYNLRFFSLSLTLGFPLLCCLHVVWVSQNRWQNAIGLKKASSHSLAIIRDVGTESRAGPDPDIQYFNNGSQGQKLSSTSGQAELVAEHCNSLKVHVQ